MSATPAYKYPNTAAPSLGTYSMVVAHAPFTDLDTGCAIVHNFGASGMSGSLDLTSFLPIVIVNNLAAPTTSIVDLFNVVFTDSNTITITKTAAVGSASTLLVQILRPSQWIR